MISLIRPILFSFLQSTQVKRMIIDLLRALAEKSDNTVDDQAVELSRARSIWKSDGMGRTTNPAKFTSTEAPAMLLRYSKYLGQRYQVTSPRTP